MRTPPEASGKGNFLPLKRPPHKSAVVEMKKYPVFLACFAAALVVVSVLFTYPINQPSRDYGSQPHVERTATVDYVVDGDTIHLVGEEKVRLVGVNTPELHSSDAAEKQRAELAKEFVENLCPSGAEVGLDVDDLKTKDRYGRTLAIVFVRIDNVWTNLNVTLLRERFAEILYIPPSEFNPYKWGN